MKRFDCILQFLAFFLFVLCVNSCANRGMGPQGGPKDETPPVVLKETPENGSVNFRDKRIEILFDEYIQLDKVADNVLISPPQQRPPEVKALGKKVIVTFDEDLTDSTTYTIDFGSAICDNNERNPLPGYSFAFSTGDVIDSLEISGQLLNAEDLNPISGIIVGIHRNLDDSAIATIPFTRIAKTDEDGYFIIHNIKPDSYRLYALQDVSKDYIYQPGEGLAIYDSVITPICHTEILLDTIWKDSITIDTIMQVKEMLCEPEDLVLLFFNENKQRRYFQRVTRDEQHFFKLTFAAPQDSMPIIRSVTNDSLSTDSVSQITDFMSSSFLQVNQTKDTIVCWLTDSVFINTDTLRFELTYQKSDSVYQLQWQTDTINAVYRAPRISQKAKERMEKNKQTPVVELSSNGKSPFEIYNPLIVNTNTPIRFVAADSVRLYQLNDTIAEPIVCSLLPADSSYMSWRIYHDWQADTEYRLVIDSAAFTDIYSSVNNAFRTDFKTRTLDEYSTLTVKIAPFDARAIIQILDEKDTPVRTLAAQANGTRFEYLSPKSYYIRMYIDLNGDSIWTTGDYLTHRQPEPVYYFPSKLTLRANWDFEETFNYLELPIDEQKPLEIIKDAATAKKK